MRPDRSWAGPMETMASPPCGLRHTQATFGAVDFLGLGGGMGSGSPAQPIHDGHAHFAQGHRFGDDFIDSQFVKGAQAEEDAQSGLRELAAAGDEDQRCNSFPCKLNSAGPVMPYDHWEWGN